MSESAVEAKSTSANITVHHLANSQKILWLLEELELQYHLKRYERTAGFLAPDELLAVHPLGKSPAITDGDAVIAESGAIIEYLITKYGQEKLKSSDAGWISNIYFTHYAEGTLMPLLINKLLFTTFAKRIPFLLRPVANSIFSGINRIFIDPRLKQNNDFIENHLQKSQTGWFANGDHPTSADFQMFIALEALEARYPDTSPKIKDCLSKIHERLYCFLIARFLAGLRSETTLELYRRPAYKNALIRGGMFAVARLP